MRFLDNIQYPYAGMVATALLVLVALAVLFVTGCASTSGTGSTTARVAVSYATAKYVEKAGGAEAQKLRAARVVAVVDQIEGLASGDSSVTVSALRAYVAQRLPVDLSPADRILAGTLIDVAAAELEARIGAGDLKSEALLKVREVLKWVREGAAPYAAASPAT